MPDISAILTAHREGALAGPSLRSFREAIDHARAEGLSVEPLLVLDRPDPLTRQLFEECEVDGKRLVVTDGGDPALTRNRALAEASGDFAALLDADDLWGFNWLAAAHRFCQSRPERIVAHSQVNVVFGGSRQVWWHVDSEAPGFELGYLRIGNYWDALSFGLTRIYRDHPFRRNALADGYGHEDWHWNATTLAAGIQHRPVPDTVHFKRRRRQSQMALCEERDVVPWPSPLSRFDYVPPAAAAAPASASDAAAGETPNPG